jgi:hypothetical protein
MNHYTHNYDQKTAILFDRAAENAREFYVEYLKENCDFGDNIMKAKTNPLRNSRHASRETSHRNGLADLLREDVSWAVKEKKRDELVDGIRQLEQIIFKLESEIKAELSVLTYQWNEKRIRASNLSDYEKEFEYVSREFHKSKKLHDQLNHITEEGLSEKVQLDHLQKQIDSLHGELARADQNKGTLPQTPETCSLCGLPLDEIHREVFRANRNKVIAENNKLIDQCTLQQKTHEIRIRDLRAAYVEVEKEIRAMGDVQKLLASVEHRLSDARSAEHDALGLKDEIEKLKQKLTHRTFAKRELLAIEALGRQVQENGYDEIRHAQVKTNIRNLLAKESA